MFFSSVLYIIDRVIYQANIFLTLYCLSKDNPDERVHGSHLRPWFFFNSVSLLHQLM